MIFEKVTLKLFVETEKTSSGIGSCVKEKRAECGKTDLPGRPAARGSFSGFCLASMDCAASPAALDKERRPGLGCLCQRGNHHHPNLALAVLPCVGLSCPMNLPCPTGTSVLLRWGHFSAQICCCTVTHGEHEDECVLPELSKVPSTEKRISLLFYFFLTGDSRGVPARALWLSFSLVTGLTCSPRAGSMVNISSLLLT